MNYTIMASNFEGFKLGQVVSEKDMEDHDIPWLVRTGMIEANNTAPKTIKKSEE